jgi:hypothetical protein
MELYWSGHDVELEIESDEISFVVDAEGDVRHEMRYWKAVDHMNAWCVFRRGNLDCVSEIVGGNDRVLAIENVFDPELL